MTTNEKIMDDAYSKGNIHPQPCSQCGVVECATCLDEVKVLMEKARQAGREEGVKETKLSYRQLGAAAVRIRGLEKENAELYAKLENRPIIDCMGSKTLLKEENARLRQSLINGSRKLIDLCMLAKEDNLLLDYLKGGGEVVIMKSEAFKEFVIKLRSAAGEKEGVK